MNIDEIARKQRVKHAQKRFYLNFSSPKIFQRIKHGKW
jgi:hypothetical protein